MPVLLLLLLTPAPPPARLLPVARARMATTTPRLATAG